MKNIKAMKNSNYMSAYEALEESGMTLKDCVLDSIVPACCVHGCVVEPDGRCIHNNPSVLIDLEII